MVAQAGFSKRVTFFQNPLEFPIPPEMNEQKFCTLPFLIAYFSNTFPVRTVMLGPLKDGVEKNLFKLALQNPGASLRFASILKSSRFFLLCVCTAVEKVY